MQVSSRDTELKFSSKQQVSQNLEWNTGLESMRLVLFHHCPYQLKLLNHVQTESWESRSSTPHLTVAFLNFLKVNKSPAQSGYQLLSSRGGIFSFMSQTTTECDQVKSSGQVFKESDDTKQKSSFKMNFNFKFM